MNGYLLLLIIVCATLLISVGLFYLGRFFFKSEIQQSIDSPNQIKVTKGVLLQAVIIVSVLMTLFYFETTGHRWAAILIAFIYLGATGLVYFQTKNGTK